MSAVHRDWLNSQAHPTPIRKLPASATAPATCPWRHNTHSLARDEVRVVLGGEAGAEFDTVRRFARTEGEAFRTPEWRDPISGPYSNPNPIAEALRWAVVVVIALAMVGATL
ncbi:hypothetical protein [Ottowia oryzae]